MSAGDSGNSTPGDARHLAPQEKVVLVLDVVESVRLIEANQDVVIPRWLDLARGIERMVDQRFHGQLRKKTGDGLIFEFTNSPDAAGAAFAIHRLAEEANRNRPVNQQILLRVAIDVGSLLLLEGDLYGRDLNRAMRLGALAGPGETVVTARVRDALVSGLDADVEDLGDCHLRHIQEPVRAYRIGPPGPSFMLEPVISNDEFLPALAIIPLQGGGDAQHAALGEVLAEELIFHFGRSPELRVISRLSTTALGGRGLTVDEIASRLRADYVLSGVYQVTGERLALDVELAEASAGNVVWSDRIVLPLADLLHGEQEAIAAIVGRASEAILLRELRLARSHALPTLKHYTLLMAAVALMHRLSPADFNESKRILEELIGRASRQALPNAWLAKWHVLRVQQGWSDDPVRDAQLASQATRMALDVDPECSLALAIDGFVHTNLLKELDVAMERYDLALQTCPSNSLAWLLRGTLNAFRDEGHRAVADVERALQLSPLDPNRFFYESLASTAYLSARRFERALEHAERSLRLNRTHTSTLRAKGIAQLHLGRVDEARQTGMELMRLEPGLTIEKWRGRSPAAHYKIGDEWAATLKEIGVPEQ